MVSAGPCLCYAGSVGGGQIGHGATGDHRVGGAAVRAASHEQWFVPRLFFQGPKASDEAVTESARFL